jgi:hypothetical protein
MTAISTTKRFALLLALMAAMLLACAGAAWAQTLTLTSTVKQSGFADFSPNPVPINGSPYDYSGQDYASLGSIDEVSITLTIFDGDTGTGEFDFDRDQLTLGLDGIDTGIKLNDFPDEQTTTQTITGVPNNAADILAALKADGQLNATVIDQSPDDNIIELDATSDTTLVLTDLDTTAPTVTDTTPDGTVSRTATVTATFDEEVQNVTSSTFFLERQIAAKVKTDPPKYVLVDATVDLIGGIYVLDPVQDLPKGNYRATITTEVTDEAGNPLAANEVWTFTVEN